MFPNLKIKVLLETGNIFIALRIQKPLEAAVCPRAIQSVPRADLSIRKASQAINLQCTGMLTSMAIVDQYASIPVYNNRTDSSFSSCVCYINMLAYGAMSGRWVWV